MPRYSLASAIVVVMVSLLPAHRAEAQFARQSMPRRHAGEGSSSQSQVGGWWNGQVHSFKHRWRLSDSSNKTGRSSKKVVRSSRKPTPRKRPAGRANKRSAVRRVSYQTPVPAAVAAKGPAAVRPAVAPGPSKPADPATAGLVPGYPQFSGSMYPSPRPDVPYQIGGAAITNQAFAPHEMLYPHSYRALYPPYYYKVSGGWMVTPWGVWSRDTWKLEGTEVEVKYRPRISFLTGFTPPLNR